jgi:hypothetical protein
MASKNVLWSFKYDTKTLSNYQNSNSIKTLDSYTPLLVPANVSRGRTANQNLIEAINTSINTVNVARDFPWTYSPAGNPARNEVPTITLNEKRLKTNAFISSIIYSFGSTKEGLTEITNYLDRQGFSNFTSVLKQLKDTLVQGAYTGVGAISNIPDTVSRVLDPTQENVAQSLNTRGQGVVSDFAKFFEDRAFDTNETLDSPLLQSYKNLYPSVNTGWQYVMPYFDDYYGSSQNVFGEDSGSDALNVLKFGADTLRTISGVVGALQRPFGFSFQEKAKFYNFPSEGEEFSFTFPLINTGSVNFYDVVRNWQLIFLLLYQNKPARINRNLIEPPVFYEVSIPGQKYLPFCYITGITVEFKGSRRELSFDLDVQITNENETTKYTVDPGVNGPFLPGEQRAEEVVRDLFSEIGSKNFRTIIPDAYVVKVNMKSLVAETRNFMAYTILGSDLQKSVAKITDLDAQNASNALSRLGNSAINSNGSANNGVGGGSAGGLQSGANTPLNPGTFIPEISRPLGR